MNIIFGVVKGTLLGILSLVVLALIIGEAQNGETIVVIYAFTGGLLALRKELKP